MPRAGQVRSHERLSDRVAIGVLTHAFPPALVDDVLARAGRVERRSRLLPARLVVYFVLAMGLFSGEGYEEVARRLTEGLQGMRRWRKTWTVPSTAAIWRARARLGVEPLKLLFGQVCRPVADTATPGAFYRGRRLVALDGTTFDLPDTGSNVEAFGRPARSGSSEAQVYYPQIRLVALVECGTHSVFAAATGAPRTSKIALAGQLFTSLGSGMLLMAEQDFVGFDLWQAASATGADLLWRVRKDVVLAVIEQLPDGSYLSEILSRRDPRGTRAGHRVRVIEYRLDGHDGQDGVFRLLTTLLNPVDAPALELAALYAERWEFESTLDQIKTYLCGPHLILRSQHAIGAEQELYGLLLVHHAIRTLIHQAVREGDHDSDRISFLRTLRVIRGQVADRAAVSPRRAAGGSPPPSAHRIRLFGS